MWFVFVRIEGMVPKYVSFSKVDKDLPERPSPVNLSMASKEIIPIMNTKNMVRKTECVIGRVCSKNHKAKD